MYMKDYKPVALCNKTTTTTNHVLTAHIYITTILALQQQLLPLSASGQNVKKIYSVIN